MHKRKSSSSKRKSLRLADMDWIGFDLDHTIVRYKLKAVSELIFRGFMQYLTSEKPDKYDQSLLELQYDHSQCNRGMLFDKQLGHLLVLDEDKHVVSAWHGSTPVDNVDEVYPVDSAGSSLLADFECAHTDRFWPLITYFEMPANQLITHLVPYLDSRFSPSPELYEGLFKDLLASFTANFAEFGKGWYFPILRQRTEMREEIANYIYQRSDVREWLLQLRAKGKRVFLVTNSRLDYANLLCTYALGADWQNLFDVTVVHAQKDSFFKLERPFHHADLRTLSEQDEVKGAIRLGGLYAYGNWRQLDELFQQVSGKPAPEVCYFGDHLRSDMLAVHRHSRWHAVLVLEELEHVDQVGGLEQHHTRRLWKRAKRGDEAAVEAAAEAVVEGQCVAGDTRFGDFFTCTKNGKRVKSYWKSFIDRFACAAVSDVEVLTRLPLDAELTALQF